MEKSNKKLFHKIKKQDAFNKRTTAEKVIFAIAFVLFSIYAVIIFYPLFYLVLKSLQYLKDFLGATWKGDGIPPTFYFKSGLDFSNYLKAFTEMRQSTPEGEVGLLGMMFNSIWYTAIRIVFNVLMCALTGYNLAKYKFPGSNFLYGLAIFTMTIPVVGTTGSTYKLAVDIGFYNTPLWVVLISLAGFGFNFLVMYGFFSNVSWNYAEAVFLDGGGHFTAFFKRLFDILPNSRSHTANNRAGDRRKRCLHVDRLRILPQEAAFAIRKHSPLALRQIKRI